MPNINEKVSFKEFKDAMKQWKMRRVSADPCEIQVT